MKMMQMQKELVSLRSVVAQEQIKEQLDVKQADSQNPLTYTEKTELIDSIHKLPPDDMEKVILIVQELHPPRGEGMMTILRCLWTSSTHTHCASCRDISSLSRRDAWEDSCN